MKRYRSHGAGAVLPERFETLAENMTFEFGALVLHAANVMIGSSVCVRHHAILKAHFKNQPRIGNE